VSKDHGLSSSRAVGFAGSALVAVGGLGAGALPVGTPYLAGSRHARLGLVCVYTGLALLLLAWWWYGRITRGSNADESCRTAGRTLALWVVPLVLAPPLFSRDVYSYLAQGLMIDSGIDVYRNGPSAVGGLAAAQVPAIWQHTPSPYGPVFLIVAEVVAGLLSSHLLLGVIAMRLVAIAGLTLLAGSVPVLARSAGVRPSAATWLAVLNPLVLIHLVGGAHTAALMVGLLAAGLAAAVRHRPIAAVALVLAYWTWWVRTRRTPSDQAAGFAVTGIVACLISPVSWVHHLVWVLPALFWLLDRGRTLVAGVAYVLLGSSFVWLWWAHPLGWAAFAGSNLYVWIAVALMAFVTAEDLGVPASWRQVARRSSALRRRPAQGTDVAG
jgi:hypothetical protein